MEKRWQFWCPCRCPSAPENAWIRVKFDDAKFFEKTRNTDGTSWFLYGKWGIGKFLEKEWMERETGIEPATPSLGSMLILLKLFNINRSGVSIFNVSINSTWHMETRPANVTCGSNVLQCYLLSLDWQWNHFWILLSTHIVFKYVEVSFIRSFVSI